MAIHNNLLKHRNRIGKSQQCIADYLDIDRRTYINWETGKTDVKSEFIPKLAQFFDIDIGILFESKKLSLDLIKDKMVDKDQNNTTIFIITDPNEANMLFETIKYKCKSVKYLKFLVAKFLYTIRDPEILNFCMY